MADSIKVVVLEAEFAALSRLGLPISLSLQLQQSGLKLADALWTARASESGFSVSLFWPSEAKASKRGRRKRKVVKVRKEKCGKVRNNSSKATTITNTVTELPASIANHEPEEEILINAQPSASVAGKPTEVTALSTSTSISVTPHDESPHNISAGLPSASDEDVRPVDLKLCSEVNYEKKGCVHGVSYCNNCGEAGWTPVVGRKRRRPQNLPQAFLRRLPPDVRKTYANDSDSDSDQDLNNLIPDHAAVTFCAVDDTPGLSVKTRSTQQWTPIAARTRAKLRTN